MILPRRLAPGALALLLAATIAAAGGAFRFVRVVEPAPTVPGTWTCRFAGKTGEGAMVGLAVVADWWEGPGDDRVPDPKRTAMPGLVYEVRRGEGPWTALPAADRDPRLVARAEAPADCKALFTGGADGPWTVRQAAGGGFPRTLRMEFTLEGDPLLVKDLRVKSLALPGIDPEPVLGRPYHPDRVGNHAIAAGTKVKAVVVVENCGARRTKEVDLDLLVAPWGKRQGPRLGFAQVPPLDPGATAELTVEGVLPEDVAKEKGIFAIVAIVNPRSIEREVETYNNAMERAFLWEPPVAPDPLSPDVRDR